MLQVDDSNNPVKIVVQVDGDKDFIVLVPWHFGMLGKAFLLIKPAGNLSKPVYAVVLVSEV